MRFIRATTLAFAIALAVTGCSDEPASTKQEVALPAEPKLLLNVEPISKDVVRFIVTTNLPTPFDVAASVNLAGQDDDDVWVGHSEFVTLTQPTTTFTLDTSKAQDPLPKGEYEAEVNFYPNWKQNQKLKSVPKLTVVKSIELKGSGESIAAATRRNEQQRWVMATTHMNMPWDEQLFVSKLGPYEKGQADLSHLHDAYYFPEADMTLIVNRLKNELTIWRKGRQSN
jgi:hypothetical protein